MKHTVVVTGGTKGLGREISLAFARLGHSVIALYANDSQAAERIKSEFADMGVNKRRSQTRRDFR